MKKQDKESPIFTPSNEPYLGRNALKAFDDLIISCLDINKAIAARTHSIKLNDIK